MLLCNRLSYRTDTKELRVFHGSEISYCHILSCDTMFSGS